MINRKILLLPAKAMQLFLHFSVSHFSVFFALSPAAKENLRAWPII